MNQHAGYPLIAYERAGFSAEAFMRMAEQGLFRDAGKVELVRGSIERMAPPPSLDHAKYNATVLLLLGTAYGDTEFALALDLGVETAETTVRAPDIAVVRPGAPSKGAVGSEFILLAVEIAASSQQRDLVEKAPEYASGGIPHYWVVDLDKRVTHIFGSPHDGIYTQRAEVAFGQEIVTPAVNRVLTIR